jgi:aminoglycoside 3-N-acetyltransferase
VEAEGKVLMLGAPLDTMTLIHHSEHLARLLDKHVVRTEVPLATAEGVVWRWVEEFDTSDPVVDGLPSDFIEQIVSAYLLTGEGRRGMVGSASSVLVDAAPILKFAIAWLQEAVGE